MIFIKKRFDQAIKEDGTIDRALDHNKIIMLDTIETQNGFRVYVSFSFSLSLFLVLASSHCRKMLFGPRLQLVHIQKPDHPPSVSHESHPKLDPYTHHNNALNSNKELKKGRDNHTFALGGIENNTSARLLFFGVSVALLVS
jgi:hypothetical protein